MQCICFDLTTIFSSLGLNVVGCAHVTEHGSSFFNRNQHVDTHWLLLLLVLLCLGDNLRIFVRVYLYCVCHFEVKCLCLVLQFLWLEFHMLLAWIHVCVWSSRFRFCAIDSVVRVHVQINILYHIDIVSPYCGAWFALLFPIDWFLFPLRLSWNTNVIIIINRYGDKRHSCLNIAICRCTSCSSLSTVSLCLLLLYKELIGSTSFISFLLSANHLVSLVVLTTAFSPIRIIIITFLYLQFSHPSIILTIASDVPVCSGIHIVFRRCYLLYLGIWLKSWLRIDVICSLICLCVCNCAIDLSLFFGIIIFSQLFHLFACFIYPPCVGNLWNVYELFIFHISFVFYMYSVWDWRCVSLVYDCVEFFQGGVFCWCLYAMYRVLRSRTYCTKSFFFWCSSRLRILRVSCCLLRRHVARS